MKYLGEPRSGSIASDTYAHNRGGQYVRVRVGRGGPGDAFFATLPALWETTLTDAQRQAWVLFARGRMVAGKLGQVIELTGFQWFVRVNRSLLSIGPGLRADPPDLLPTSPPQLEPLLIGASFVAGQAHLEVTGAVPSAWLFAVDSTGIVSAGTMSAPGRGHYWRILTISSAVASSVPVDVSTGAAWFGQYGAPPVTGDVAFFGIRPMGPLMCWGARQVFRYVSP